MTHPEDPNLHRRYESHRLLADRAADAATATATARDTDRAALLRHEADYHSRMADNDKRLLTASQDRRRAALGVTV